MERNWRLLVGLSFLPLAFAALLAPPTVGATDPPAGQVAFNDSKCDMCHSVPAVGIESKAKSEKLRGPDMPTDAVNMDAEQLAKYLRKQEPLDGKTHKKEYKGSDEDLQALIDWLRSLETK